MDSTDPLDALALRVRGLASVASGRVVIGIAGSPGAGKSTLAANLVDVLNGGPPGAVAVPVAVSMDGAVPTDGGARVAVAVPMDGFHLANATLDRLGLRDRKGALETFDGWGFLALLTRLRRETAHTVYAPGFDRAVDEPVAGAIAVEPAARIVIVEGNYLLCEGEPWGLVREHLDEAWFCAASENERMSRLTARHIAHGRTPEAAEAWAREVDGANARIIEPTRSHADLVVSGTTGAVLA
ncbi:nucleoside/nucleotide kinase family protein [Agromyces silvae]|uniref:nucleoside/nucleotide kinase family protein n=1 Tax=Agromyces silvae TaxID=3388266 RepID=UPI00280BC052|nr:nucleoside/nucleotide kinase family protein [Agromyces protaetiae]